VTTTQHTSSFLLRHHWDKYKAAPALPKLLYWTASTNCCTGQQVQIVVLHSKYRLLYWTASTDCCTAQQVQIVVLHSKHRLLYWTASTDCCTGQQVQIVVLDSKYKLTHIFTLFLAHCRLFLTLYDNYLNLLAHSVCNIETLIYQEGYLSTLF
jgi:hypothetical protein